MSRKQISAIYKVLRTDQLETWVLDIPSNQKETHFLTGYCLFDMPKNFISGALTTCQRMKSCQSVLFFFFFFFFFLFTQRKSRDRQETNVKPITEFRQFHQVVAIAPLVLKVKRLACFCTACRDNHTDLCQNRDYTGMYKVYIMKQVIAPQEEEESIAP